MSRDALARMRAADPLAGALPDALPARPALPPRAAKRPLDRRLLAANVVVLVAVLSHGIDHALQPRGLGALSWQVLVGGASMSAVAATSLWLTLRSHPLARIVAAFSGAWLAIAIWAGHLAPEWSAFSDRYAGLGLGIVSWAAAIAVMVAGVALGAVAALSAARPR